MPRKFHKIKVECDMCGNKETIIIQSYTYAYACNKCHKVTAISTKVKEYFSKEQKKVKNKVAKLQGEKLDYQQNTERKIAELRDMN